MITRLSTGHRCLRAVLALALLAQCTVVGIARADVEPAVENVRFSVSGYMVEIFYDLVGPPDGAMAVQVILKRESDPAFEWRPKTLVGDVNLIVFPAMNRRMVWVFREEFPEGLEGDDYYFVVEAEPAGEKKSSGTTLWIVGGVLALGVGVGALLLGQSDDGGTGPSKFPLPPGRPN